MALFIFGSLVFVAFGVNFVVAHRPFVGNSPLVDKSYVTARVVGVLGIVVFGAVGIPSGIYQMVKPLRLTIDDNGFKVKPQIGYKPIERSWSECNPFAVVKETSVLSRRVAISGVDGSARRTIRPGYGHLSAAQLATLLNSYRDRALQRQWPP